MPTPNSAKMQIDRILYFLIEAGLADDQNFPFLDDTHRPVLRVSFPGADHISSAMRDRPYEQIYRDLAESRAYNIKMLDGALVQMTYQFVHHELLNHRLAFFPSPSLREFQNDPEGYLYDELYADIVAESIVHVPMRFDYDSSEELHKVLTHPKSHFTIGQYQNCRIPVSSPLTPLQFIDFILRNFYHTAFESYTNKLPANGSRFSDSIQPEERRVVHIVVPTV